MAGIDYKDRMRVDIPLRLTNDKKLRLESWGFTFLGPCWEVGYCDLQWVLLPLGWERIELSPSMWHYKIRDEQGVRRAHLFCSEGHLCISLSD